MKSWLEEPPWWGAAAACAVLSVAFCWPVLASGAAFGIDDWDQQLFYLEAARRSLVVYGQAPLWNPWYCGGSPLLANPSSAFLDPLLAIGLPWDVLRAAKVGLALHQWVGMLGAWLFARRLGARGVAGLVAPVVFGLSSVYTLHLATGHVIWLAYGFLPFSAMFTVGAIDAAAEGQFLRAAGEALAAGLFAALLLFAGNAYFFVYQCLWALCYGLARALPAKPLHHAFRPLAGGAAVGLATFAWSAIKLLPMLSFLGAVSHYDAQDDSGASWSVLSSALFSRDPSLTALQSPGMHWRWWEYGGYVGVVPFGLAIAAMALAWKKTLRLGLVTAGFALVAMGSSGPVWPLLRGLHGFEGLRVPSRAIAFVVLGVALLAAVGATQISHWAAGRWKSPRRAAAASGVVLALVADVFLVTRPPLVEAFSLSAVDLAEAPKDRLFQQVRGRVEFKTRTRYSDLLDHAVRNEGVVNCYERLHLPIAAHPRLAKDGTPDPVYRGEAWIEGATGDSPQLEFTPNRLTLDVASARGGALVINQNYDPSWRATIGGRPLEITRRGGLLSVDLPADGAPSQVVLGYSPRLAPGAALTMLAAIASLGVLAWQWRRRRIGA